MQLLKRGLLGCIQLRNLSTKRKLAVVGSGPSAFYTILHLLKEKPNDFEIDLFEKNPSPFGLVRYGVAPDHPEVKNCIDRFNDVSEYIPNGTFKYFGNVTISDSKVGDKSKQISLKDIYDNYNGVLYAYGSSSANVPKISGIEHPGVIDSYKFVGWYNSYPEFKGLNLPLDKVKNVTIIGNGNVAIDIARILLASPEKHWSKTDISSIALDKLKNSSIENVNIIARKGVLESKFTNKEFRELLELDKEGVYFTGWNFEKFTDELKDVKFDRVTKRRMSLLEKYTGKYSACDKDKKWNLQYLKNPIGVKIKDDELLSETIFSENEIVKSSPDKWDIKPSGRISSVKNELVILATGYKCEPLDEFEQFGIPFHNGHIVNFNGKIENVDNSYCVGWVANGSTGNINSTVMNSMNAADTIINDFKDNDDMAVKNGRVGIEKILKEKNIKPVSWDDWNKIHEMEVNQGEKSGKPYEKMDFKEMLKLV